MVEDGRHPIQVARAQDCRPELAGEVAHLGQNGTTIGGAAREPRQDGVGVALPARVEEQRTPLELVEELRACRHRLDVDGVVRIESEVVHPAECGGVLILSPDGVISMNDISLSAAKPPTATVGTTLEEIERNHIQRMLNTTLWRIEGRRGAAELLGLKPSTLRSRLRKLGIRRGAGA